MISGGAQTKDNSNHQSQWKSFESSRESHDVRIIEVSLGINGLIMIELCVLIVDSLQIVPVNTIRPTYMYRDHRRHLRV